jgi:hypothetical protein
MGPCGPIPSLLHRHRPATPGRARRRAGRPWTAQHQATLVHRRRHPRRRAAGAGPHQRLVLCDGVLATLIVLRLQLPHQALAVLLGSTAPPSPAPSARSARCWPPAASPCPASPRCGCGPWRMWSPTRRPTAWSCASTAPRPRSAGPAPTEWAGARSSPASASKHPQPTMVSDGQGRTLRAGAVRPGPHARPDRRQHRGHRRPADPASWPQGPGR